MFTLRKKFTFEAAHRLPGHQGKCQRLHGHSWIGWVEVRGDKLFEQGPKAGMLEDYGILKAAVQPLVEEKLDHHFLNETLQLANPTSEVLARWLFDAMKDKLPGLTAVEIEETCTSACRYEPTNT